MVLFEEAADDGTGLLIETFADGWWYTAALPEGRRIVACMSDADLMRSLELNELDGFMRALGETRHVRGAVADAQPLGSPALRPAGSRRITAIRRCRCYVSATRRRVSIQCPGRESSRRCGRAFLPRTRSPIFFCEPTMRGLNAIAVS